MHNIGDVVVPIGDYALRSGCSEYGCAVVVSVNPFILVSEGADMKWESTVKPERFEFKRKAFPHILEKCMGRLE